MLKKPLAILCCLLITVSMLPVAVAAADELPARKLSPPVQIPVSDFIPSAKLGSFENGKVTYGSGDVGYARAYIYTVLPVAPDGYPNFDSFTFSYLGPDRQPDPDHAVGGNVRLLALDKAPDEWMGGDDWIVERTIGQVSVTGAETSPQAVTMKIDEAKLASLADVTHLILYAHSGITTNDVPTSFTYSNIAAVYAADECDGTCNPCECVYYCRFTAEGQCCYVAPFPTSEAVDITILPSELRGEGATLKGGEVTLTSSYDDNFVYFDVNIPNGNTIYDYESLSFTFKGISGDTAYKTIKLSAGAPKTPVDTFKSYTSLAETANNVANSTGSSNMTFSFDDSALRELHDSTPNSVRFAINMPAEAASVLGANGGNVTVEGSTVFEMSKIKLKPKKRKYVEATFAGGGTNYSATGDVGRHALTQYGYDYELWSQRVGDPAKAPGIATMNIPPTRVQAGKGGIFNTVWVDTHNVLIRAGKKFTDAKGIKVGSSTVGESHDKIGEIAIDFETEWDTTDNVAYLSVYGWAFFKPGSEPTREENGTETQFSNEIEYYIVQDRKSYNPTSQGGTLKGSAVIDGILYDFYVTDRIGQPMLNSDSGNFKQYWSMPRNTSDHRQSGKISVSEHFRQWEKVGMTMDGPLYEAAWKIESYTGGKGADGYAYVTKNIFTINGIEPQAESASASGKTYTVAEGDCLSTIAKANGTTWQLLYELNKDVITDPNRIYPGQIIKLP